MSSNLNMKYVLELTDIFYTLYSGIKACLATITDL